MFVDVTGELSKAEQLLNGLLIKFETSTGMEEQLND